MNSTSVDFSSVRFSTDEFEPRDRIEAWREIYGRTILKVEVEPYPQDSFRSSLTLRTLPGLGIAYGESSGACYRRTPATIDNDDFLLLINVGGSGLATQRDREVRLEQGDATLLWGAETGATDLPSGHRCISLGMQYKTLAPMIVDLDGALARPIPRDMAALQLLVSYTGLFREAHALATPQLRRLVVTQIYDLAALAIGATRDVTEISHGRSVRAARLRAIKSDIVENIGQQPFSIDEVAARHGISPRYIRRLFASDETTFTEFVLEQRLARAHRMLSDVRYSTHTISSIAFEIGFSDLSYFNRSFRRRYAKSPSDVRNDLLASPLD